MIEGWRNENHFHKIHPQASGVPRLPRMWRQASEEAESMTLREAEQEIALINKFGLWVEFTAHEGAVVRWGLE